eukprot:TRINITY_DN1701_c2_g1_i1.p3 TRINITY_DN1701_c2_g1~~TRINITY_DN1701_c2_g1_i1.p3  ORF type:complete len:143 (+),score=24.92 TRINITY_DN1701_c2_g1_i1:84-512(+)
MDFEVHKTGQEVAMEALMDSCAVRAIMAGGGGFVMGMGFSIFSMVLGAGTHMDNVGLREFWRRAMQGAVRMGRGFGMFGFFFAGFELALEKRRGRHDLWNPGLAGGSLGMVQGYRFGGPPFAILGAAGLGGLFVGGEMLLGR